MNRQVFIFVFLFLSLLAKGFAEDISVTVSQPKVGLNESFTVIFSSNQSIPSQPDFSPLQADFDILSTNQGQNISIINGSVAQESRWNLVLIPKREGDLVIPSIQFGPFLSAPVPINVIASSAQKPDDKLFIECEIRPTDAIFEQTQLLYIIRVFTSYKIAQAALSDVQTNDPDAIIERLGNDIEYEHHHNNGRRYIVFERRYVILPQHAGELIVSPITFEGKVVTGGHSFFDMQTQFMRLVSEPIKVQIKDIPAPFNKNNWFAAKDVKYTEEWSSDPSKMTLGEPLTWTLTIKADGCMGNQIPTPQLSFPNEFKHYLDKVETSNHPEAEGFSGIKQIKVALIAMKSGEFSLPKISIDWWDLKTNEVHRIDIPERTIQVLNGPVAMNTTESAMNTAPIKAVYKTENQIVFTLWEWCGIGISILILIVLCALLSRRTSSSTLKPDSLSQVKSQLRKACQSNDAKQTEACLLAWAGIVYPQLKLKNMIGIKSQLPHDFQESIDALYQALYSQKTDWHGELLWKAFSSFNPHKKQPQVSKKQTEELRELYPM